jgi:hypothetical protein
MRIYKKLTPEQVEERFLDRIIPEPNSGCWLWIGVTYPNGYGCFQRHTYAHRWSYERYVGPIPDGLELDHLCRTRCCANPSHLEPVTRRVNTLRGTSVFAKNAAKTHCPRGHLLGGDNVTASARRNGSRACAQCGRDNTAARRLRLGDAWREEHKLRERARRAKRRLANGG